jgi:hypothetical protein
MKMQSGWKSCQVCDGGAIVSFAWWDSVWLCSTAVPSFESHADYLYLVHSTVVFFLSFFLLLLLCTFAA